MKIKITKDGPYLVTGKAPLADQIIVADEDGESVAWETGEPSHEHEQYALCRCGQSGSKPFCNGAHRIVGFNGTETAVRATHADQALQLDGPTLKLDDAVDLCADARFCHRAGGAWNLIKRTDDPNVRATVIDEAELCPSGRYVAVDKETRRSFEPELPPSIGLVQDPHEGVSGPLWVRGGIEVESEDGFVYEVRNRVTLCRCGASKNKPFCDGSHIPEGFRDET